MAMEVEIVVVGGGLGGLALAIGLQVRGIRSHVFEKAPGKVRVPDVSGEITKAYSQDLEKHGRDVRKARALRQMEDLEGVEYMRAAMELTHPDAVREARACDRLPLITWSDPCEHVVLLGSGIQLRKTLFAVSLRFFWQLSILLQEALHSSTPETAIADAVKRYEEIRMPRTTEIQGYVAESMGWPRIIPEEKQKLSLEFGKWVKLYHEAMSRDLSSTYWKP